MTLVLFLSYIHLPIFYNSIFHFYLINWWFEQIYGRVGELLNKRVDDQKWLTCGISHVKSNQMRYKTTHVLFQLKSIYGDLFVFCVDASYFCSLCSYVVKSCQIWLRLWKMFQARYSTLLRTKYKIWTKLGN